MMHTLSAPSPGHAPRSAGFTLVEVLVALGIVAIALAAGLRAAGGLTRTAERQATLVLAQVCAENELVRLRLSRQMPGVGEQVVDCPQLQSALRVELIVRPTPNPNFLKADARVLQGSEAVLQLSTVVGRF